MPPAFVLSQDQTLKFVSRTFTARAETRQPQTPNFRSRYLHFSNVMDTKDMFIQGKRGAHQGCGIGIINRYTEPEDPRTGRRRPHVPSSKINNVKEPPNKIGGQPMFPDLYISGDLLSVCAGDRWKRRLLAASPPVKRHIWRGAGPVNDFLHFYFGPPKTHGNPRVSGSRAGPFSRLEHQSELTRPYDGPSWPGHGDRRAPRLRSFARPRCRW